MGSNAGLPFNRCMSLGKLFDGQGFICEMELIVPTSEYCCEAAGLIHANGLKGD